MHQNGKTLHFEELASNDGSNANGRIPRVTEEEEWEEEREEREEGKWGGREVGRKRRGEGSEYTGTRSYH